MAEPPSSLSKKSRSEYSHSKEQASHIQSLQRGLKILELLADEPEGLLAKTISMRCGLHVSTCYHLLNTLVANGYVLKQANTQRFYLAQKISFASANPYAAGQLVRHLQPHVQALRDLSLETSYLSLRNNGEIVLSALVDSRHSLRVSLLSVGYASGNHAMALGKAILAYLDQEDVTRYLHSHGMPAFTAKTICKADLFAQELAKTRARGYGLDETEFSEEVCCIAAPIFDMQGRVIGSIGIAMPEGRYQKSASEQIERVLTVAQAATRALVIQAYGSI